MITKKNVSNWIANSPFSKGSDELKAVKFIVNETTNLFRMRTGGMVPCWNDAMTTFIKNTVALPMDYEVYRKGGFLYYINGSAYSQALRLSLDPVVSTYIDDLIHNRNKKKICHPFRMITAEEINNFISIKYKRSIRPVSCSCTSAFTKSTVVYTLECRLKHYSNGPTLYDTMFVDEYSLNAFHLANSIIAKGGPVRLDELNKKGCLAEMYKIINSYDNLFAYKTETYLKIMEGGKK